MRLTAARQTLKVLYLGGMRFNSAGSFLAETASTHICSVAIGVGTCMILLGRDWTARRHNSGVLNFRGTSDKYPGSIEALIAARHISGVFHSSFTAARELPLSDTNLRHRA
jgi:hypothetical protein